MAEQVVRTNAHFQSALTKSAAMPHTPALRLWVAKAFGQTGRKLMSETDRQAMEAAIIADPKAAPVIRGTGGIRKLRWAGSGRGKRGSIRTIYCHHVGSGALYLLAAYAKAAQDDLSPADKKALARLVTTIKNEEILQ